MTVCIAQKAGSKIFLASDSRISIGALHSDNAFKVLPLSIRINLPRDEETHKTEERYSSSWGFGFAGTFAAQNAIKDFLAIVFQKLTFVPTLGPLTFEKICSFVLDLYKHVSWKLSTELEDYDGLDFFLCGTCPDDGSVKLAKFSIDHGSSIDEFKPKYTVYKLDKDFPLAIGSGEYRFRDEYKKLNGVSPQRRAIIALKKVIDDPDIPSVGGNIQYGEACPGLPFSIHGVVVPGVHIKTGQKLNHFFFGGIDTLDEVFRDINGLFITGEFLHISEIMP